MEWTLVEAPIGKPQHSMRDFPGLTKKGHRRFRPSYWSKIEKKKKKRRKKNENQVLESRAANVETPRGWTVSTPGEVAPVQRQIWNVCMIMQSEYVLEREARS
jgi:hypothetical protein